MNKPREGLHADEHPAIGFRWFSASGVPPRRAGIRPH
jgi:hypothetical protein